MNNHYKHKDFYLGAYLISEGCSLVDHYRENGLTTFVFEDSDNLKSLVENFYTLKGTVDALSYSSVVRTLKNLIHNNRSTQQHEAATTYRQEDLNDRAKNKLERCQ